MSFSPFEPEDLVSRETGPAVLSLVQVKFKEKSERILCVRESKVRQGRDLLQLFLTLVTVFRVVHQLRQSYFILMLLQYRNCPGQITGYTYSRRVGTGKTFMHSSTVFKK